MASGPAPNTRASAAGGRTGMRTGLSLAATTTSWLPRKVTRLAGTISRFAASASIHCWSADTNRSASPPASTCRARADDAAKEMTGRGCPRFAQASAAAVIDSCRLAAASTSGGLACAIAGAAANSDAKNSNGRIMQAP